MRTARDAKGKYISVPEDMTYPEWKKVIDEGGDFTSWKKQAETDGRLAEYSLDGENRKRYAARRNEWEKVADSSNIAKYIEKKTVKPIVNGDGNGIINNKREVIYQKFATGDEVNDFFYFDEKKGVMARKASLHGRWLDGLSYDERSAISWYTADGYGDINDYWRKRDGWEYISADVVEDASKQIDSAISRFTLKENIIVQRGMDDFYGASLIENKEWNDIHEIVGMTYHELGYSSTTAMYGNSVATAKPYLFEIEVPVGTGHGAYVNKLAGQFEDVEFEFLIARDSKFEIIDVYINEDTIPPQTIIKTRLITDD